MNSHSPYQIDKAGLCPRIYCKADIELLRESIDKLIHYELWRIIQLRKKNFEFIMRQINQQMIERH